MGEGCVDIFWPTLSFKRENIRQLWILKRRDLNFCVRSTQLREKSVQALLVYIIMWIVTSQPPREGKSVGTRGQKKKKLGVGGERGRCVGWWEGGVVKQCQWKRTGGKNALTTTTWHHKQDDARTFSTNINLLLASCLLFIACCELADCLFSSGFPTSTTVFFFFFFFSSYFQ